MKIEQGEVIADPDTLTVQWDRKARSHDDPGFYRQTVGWLLALGRHVVCKKCEERIREFYSPYCEQCGPVPPPHQLKL
ncbi:hypothetical protein GCM10007416_35220 [Kroppenstedtia guangzhouensis]|uniref:Uncharacterized protein n=1 Tax=Kroppenstedtia guangzhouensis TaxID=1274356 RepID=A0ABQ1H737_9BACL|nr:hypothetical protein [Kroppenstedtia guangzhouensis]GGA59042.1 hypothetical protein GCM10007416_35220 [Kroppenstedtia guangzhouensis]